MYVFPRVVMSLVWQWLIGAMFARGCCRCSSVVPSLPCDVLRFPLFIALLPTGGAHPRRGARAARQHRALREGSAVGAANGVHGHPHLRRLRAAHGALARVQRAVARPPRPVGRGEMCAVVGAWWVYWYALCT